MQEYYIFKKKCCSSIWCPSCLATPRLREGNLKSEIHLGTVWLKKGNGNVNGTFPLLEWEGNSLLREMFGSAMVIARTGMEWLADQFDVIGALKRGSITLLPDPVGCETNIKYRDQLTL